MREAMYWSVADKEAVRCGLCPHRCIIAEGAEGICGVRVNRGGTLFAAGYGRLSSVALDPIEKKPLYLFHPGMRILSVGGYGCNFRCPFCQNYEISTEWARDHEFGVPDANYIDDKDRNETQQADRKARKGSGGAVNTGKNRITPESVESLALQTVQNGNIGVAYTYNEPLTGYEFLYDCAKLIRSAGLNNVIVTNGYINDEPLEALLPLIDAMNIDLKGFTESFYHKIGGGLEDVKKTIARSNSSCHVEVTTLVLPGENEDDTEELAKWLASVDPDIPLHLTRFFPRYRYADKEPTPRETVFKLCDTAGKYLNNVFAGNMG